MSQAAEPENASENVRKSVDNFTCAAERRRAGVEQVELAAELGTHRSQISRFETGAAALPHGMGPQNYMAGLAAIVARKRESAA